MSLARAIHDTWAVRTCQQVALTSLALVEIARLHQVLLGWGQMDRVLRGRLGGTWRGMPGNGADVTHGVDGDAIWCLGVPVAARCGSQGDVGQLCPKAGLTGCSTSCCCGVGARCACCCAGCRASCKTSSACCCALSFPAIDGGGGGLAGAIGDCCCKGVR
eukprot:470360-Pelagomonas_calceolata.AAC.6